MEREKGEVNGVREREGKGRRRTRPYILTDLPTGWYAPETLNPGEDYVDPDGEDDLPDASVIVPLMAKAIERLREASDAAGGDLVAPTVETIERWKKEDAKRQD